jgi:hypothetical protein
MRSGKLTKNLAFEIGINILLSTDVKFSISLDARTNCDHSGIFFRTYIGKYGFEANVYDIRHRGEK